MTLQDCDIDSWEAASDEEHIKELFNNRTMVNPFYINYLKQDRPNVLTSFLKLWQADGNYMSRYGKEWLEKHA